MRRPFSIHLYMLAGITASFFGAMFGFSLYSLAIKYSATIEQIKMCSVLPIVCWVLSFVLTEFGLYYWDREPRQDHDRKSRRLCLACGYDMRATPYRCPECGLVRV
jgi:uncharacterized membrane protein YGL010W